MPEADWWEHMAKSRPGKLPHLEFLAELRQLLKRHGYAVAPEFNRIVVYDQDGNRVVCSFRDFDATGARELRFGGE
jgi:hypothetical protein